ncbi:MAG: BrnT family toxin [Nostoc sp.]
MNLEFEWDNQKATLNLNKHGISFEVAKRVFNDSLAYIFNVSNSFTSSKNRPLPPASCYNCSLSTG